MLFFCTDFGTSAVKTSILDEQGNLLSWAKKEYPYQLLPGEKVEISPHDLWSAFFQAADSIDPGLKQKVGCLCYDTFSPSPVFLDKEGDLVYPNIITHMDRRSRAQTAIIDQMVGKDEYLKISGIYPFPGGCSAMTYLWFKQNQPEYLEKSFHTGHLTTYLHKKLTGKWMTDLVNASMMGLYCTTAQSGWSEELIRTFSLPRSLFCDIYNPGIPLGTLLSPMAEKLGLKSGIPVTVGTNDVAAAQAGADNYKAGDIMNTTGSSEMISILTDKPVTSSHYYLRNAALPGLWQIYATTAGGFAVDWFYRQFCREIPQENFYTSYISNAIEANLEDKEISFDPYLTGDRQSLERKTGAWHGLTLATTREQMLTALLRSIQKVLSAAIDEARYALPLSPVIKISGGMATPAYLQLKKHEIPGFSFEVVDDCPLKGCMGLAKLYL